MDKILVDMIERPEFVDGLLDRILYEWNLPIIEQQLAIGVDGFYFAEDWGSETSLLFARGCGGASSSARLAIMYAKAREAGTVVGPAFRRGHRPAFPRSDRDRPAGVQPALADDHGPGRLQGEVRQPPDLLRRHRCGAAAAVRHAGRGAGGDPPAGRAAGPEGGGYILQSSHTMLEDVPIANIVAYIEEVRGMAGLA